MKTAIFAGVLFSLALPASAQLFGSITDDFQHGFYGGLGVGPTSKDFSAAAGYAERISSKTHTFSYSGASFIPALVTNANGSRSLSFSSVVHTGFSQAIYQRGHFVASIDMGGGAALPSQDAPAFNLAAIWAANLGWRLSKTYNSAPGATNNYLAIRPQFTQLTGDRGGTVVSIGIGFMHGVNGQPATP